jgi:hypothetical protein
MPYRWWPRADRYYAADDATGSCVASWHCPPPHRGAWGHGWTQLLQPSQMWRLSRGTPTLCGSSCHKHRASQWDNERSAPQCTGTATKTKTDQSTSTNRSVSSRTIVPLLRLESRSCRRPSSGALRTDTAWKDTLQIPRCSNESSTPPQRNRRTKTLKSNKTALSSLPQPSRP